jgi:hypothetical protein
MICSPAPRSLIVIPSIFMSFPRSSCHSRDLHVILAIFKVDPHYSCHSREDGNPLSLH